MTVHPVPTSRATLAAVTVDAPAEAPAEQATLGRRILVMDDDQGELDLTKACLEYLGYDAEFATHGTAAVERYAGALAAGRRFDAVLLDLTVPGGDGALSAIQRLVVLDPGVRAIVSSGYSNDPAMARHADYGFAAVLPKPYCLDDISRVLSRVVGPVQPN